MESGLTRLRALVVALLCLAPGGLRARDDIVKGEAGKALDAYLSRIAPFGFSGALLVAKHGEIVIDKGYGEANRTDHLPNTSSTVFSVGSITKQFTAAAIMTLEMAGKLKTADPISKYIENVPPDKADVTIHHLLTHTSGLVPDVGGDYDIADRDPTVRRILELPLESIPGTRFAYSNVNYTLLAAIVELVSGQPYEQYLHDHLFRPAGMKWTGYRIPMWTERVVANWYAGEKDNGTPLQKNYPYWNLIGNGGILSTTGDMYLWHRALLGTSILSDSAKMKMFTPFMNEYAYGWDVLDSPHGRLVQHNGGSDLGNSAEIRRYLDSNLVIIFFSNCFYNGRPLLDAVRGKIEAVAFGGPVTLPPGVNTGIPVPSAAAGDYRLPGSGMLKVTSDDEGMWIEGEGQKAIDLLAFGEAGGSGREEIVQRGAAALLAAFQGNYAPLTGMMADPERRSEGVKNLIERQKKIHERETGPITGVVPLSTVPSPVMEGAVETCLEVRGESGSFLMRFVSRGDRNTGLGPMDEPPSMRMELRVLREGVLSAFHIGLGRGVEIRLNQNASGDVTGLTVVSGGSTVRAVRNK